MNKIWLVMQREFLSRVQKKSFLIATILLHLIFPAIMAVLVYVAQQQKKNACRYHCRELQKTTNRVGAAQKKNNKDDTGSQPGATGKRCQ